MGKIEPAEPNMDKSMTDKEIHDFLYTSEERKRSHEENVRLTRVCLVHNNDGEDVEDEIFLEDEN